MVNKDEIWKEQELKDTWIKKRVLFTTDSGKRFGTDEPINPKTWTGTIVDVFKDRWGWNLTVKLDHADEEAVVNKLYKVVAPEDPTLKVMRDV